MRSSIAIKMDNSLGHRGNWWQKAHDRSSIADIYASRSIKLAWSDGEIAVLGGFDSNSDCLEPGNHQGRVARVQRAAQDGW